MAGLTGSHPVTAGNSVVPQPGLVPDVMPYRPLGLPYSQGLRKPKSGTAVRNTETILQRDYTRHCLEIGGQVGA